MHEFIFHVETDVLTARPFTISVKATTLVEAKKQIFNFFEINEMNFIEESKLVLDRVNIHRELF